jgi:hypothetical protein
MPPKQALYHLRYTTSPFSSGCFGDGGLLNSLPRLASNLSPLNLSLLMARITGLSYWRPASSLLFVWFVWVVLLLFLK